MIAVLFVLAGQADRMAHLQSASRVARIRGIDPRLCNPGSEEKPWLNPKQSPGCRVLAVIAIMTLEENLAELEGITGRNGETFSEDPYLTAELAVAQIKALNEQKVLTVPKHFVRHPHEEFVRRPAQIENMIIRNAAA